MRKVSIIILAVVLILVVVSIANTSFVKIQVENPQPGVDISYTFINNTGKAVSSFKSNTPSQNKRLPKGEYEINIKQGSMSYIAIRKLKGLFSTVKLNARLQQEKNRVFVGNNPDPCVSYASGVLISYSCGGSYLSAEVHVPATENIPTYTVAVSGNLINGVISNGANTTSGALVLVRQTSDEGVGSYSIYRVDSGFHPIGSNVLSELENNKSYSVTSYKDGFIVYDASLSRAVYYTSLSSRPLEISLERPKQAGLVASTIAFDPGSNGVLTLYTSSKLNKSEVILARGKNFEHFTYRKNYTSIDFCGKQICMLGSNKILDVYNLHGGNTELSFSITGAQLIKNTPNGLLVVNQNGVLNLDTATQTGSLQYSFGDYKYCGIQTDSSTKYLLCVINNRGLKSELSIDQTINNRGSIDQKVDILQSRSEIKAISMYNNLIFISPNFGQLNYQSSTGDYGPSPSIVEEINAKINEDIKNVGIDTSVYKIINPYQ